MKGNKITKLKTTCIAAVLVTIGSVSNVNASEYDLLPESSPAVNSLILMQASAASDSAMSNAGNTPATPYKERWFTTNKFHQYLGLGSLALATLTAIVPKPSEDDPESGAHHALAQGAAYLGGAAVASGLAFHYKDLSWKKFSKNPDNWHAILGTLGTLGYFAAIADAPDSAHASYGIVGAVSMLAAIKITW